ncbi:hypothetical protein [Nodularia spumigena]|jgi:hypothetical protein|uniref:Uncharacterized protein n=1 Tax=Nodularia spumigena UHCC 0060 TaxID=3110300 RepID=A0ABU5UWL0_NODSP|nr:hypothetical protein [Nodularia spumigena]MEA5525327.1 hypothetical protein [Nodularia spumigena UHCC 0143]MEA5610233.1 hypothetical protein [Nodularia spumigena UHCC 0060]
MSTQAAVAYGKNFHLYRQVIDDNFIYLELVSNFPGQMSHLHPQL